MNYFMQGMNKINDISCEILSGETGKNLYVLVWIIIKLLTRKKLNGKAITFHNS